MYIDTHYHHVYIIIIIITRITHIWMAQRCMWLSVNDRSGGTRRVGVSTRCALQYCQLAPRREPGGPNDRKE